MTDPRTLGPKSVDAFFDFARAAGWKIAIVSGGFTQAIRPLADFLDIERVEAVTLRFHPDGSYAGFDESCPTCKSKGKNVVALYVCEVSRRRNRFNYHMLLRSQTPNLSELVKFAAGIVKTAAKLHNGMATFSSAGVSNKEA